MAVLKKTKPRKTKAKAPPNPNVFNWTPKRKLAAKLLSEGIYNYDEVQERVRIGKTTLWEWRQHPIFLKEVDRLTLENELTTRAGLLRECLKGLRIKERYIEEDKNTHLHYIEEIAELQGLKKQKIELDGNMNHTGGAVTIYIPDNGRDKKQDDEQEQS